MILVASASLGLLARCKQAFPNFSALLSVRNNSSFQVGIECHPQVSIVDLERPGLNGIHGIASLLGAHLFIKIIVACPVQCDETELSLFKIGVSGCCRSDAEPRQLIQMITAVEQGEVWIRRTLLSRLMNEMQADSVDIESRTALAQRERKAIH